MTEPLLLESTGDPHCDKITSGVIGIFESVFPDRVRGYYLRGSRASGTSIVGSDIDLYVIFRDQFSDEAEYYRAQDLIRHCAQLSPILLEIIAVGELGLRRNVSAALNLKLATRLLHGDDIGPDLPPFEASSYLRSVIHTPYNCYSLPAQRKVAGAMTFPLQHIDPDGEFFGYDQWNVPGDDGLDQKSTKLLVASVGWTATAIVALRAGGYVRDKAACVDLYREHVNDEWTELVTDVHDLCRTRWHYQIPAEEDDRLRLRSLCDQALAFENHFLTLYRGYQLAELASGDHDRQMLATQRLQQIIFPDHEVASALAEAGSS